MSLENKKIYIRKIDPPNKRRKEKISKTKEEIIKRNNKIKEAQEKKRTLFNLLGRIGFDVKLIEELPIEAIGPMLVVARGVTYCMKRNIRKAEQITKDEARKIVLDFLRIWTPKHKKKRKLKKRNIY